MHDAIGRTGAPSSARTAVMGLANMPFGFYGALSLVTVPQLLAADAIPQTTIASITAATLVPSFCGFLLAPILDVRFSRRSWAIGFGLLTAMLACAAMLAIGTPARLTPLLVLGSASSIMYFNAVGGWLGSIVAPGEEGRLGASFTIGNATGFGVGAILFITLSRAAPGLVGSVAMGAIVALPMLLFFWIPESRGDRRSARESFATLWRDLGALMKRPLVLRYLLLFCLPAASFAMTNTLGGLGEVFATSERTVGLIAGIGVTAAGIVGSLLVPVLVRRVAPLLLYLAIGGVGAVFTLSLIGLPHTAPIYAVAVIGQSVFQAAAFAVEGTLIFRSIGDANPLAATQFAVLQAATSFPITYMQAIDGQAYGWHGLTSMLAVDAGLSLVSVAIVLPIALRWHWHDRQTRLQLALV